jgi:phosphoglycerol transferase MdoB-like AlkP superfamily enzyme
MSGLSQKLPAEIRFILSVYLAGMIFFFLFRVILILSNLELAQQIPTPTMVQALIMGLRFDTVISGYLLILPLILFFVFSFISRQKRLERIILLFLTLIYSIAFFICSADIPWFRHDNTRLNVASLHWTNTPGMMLKFIFQDINNYPFILIYILVVFLFYKILKGIRTATLEKARAPLSIVSSTFIFIFFIGLTLLGIRGRVAIKSPIRWGTAFFSPYGFANQLGLNPVYTLTRSWLDNRNASNKPIQYIDEDVAISYVKTFYQVSEEFYSPVARKVMPEASIQPYNVVLILMEGMSAKNMARFGNTNNLTPVLDSLWNKGISFTDFYSDGNHTFNGIYSSLFGFPSLPMKHSMKSLENQQPYGGIAKTLLSNAYQTIFFTTHDAQFDNMAGFLLPNGFQQLVSQENYSADKIISTLGAPDHVQYEEVIKRVTDLNKNGKPFFAAIMTASNHGPYIMPEGIPFKAHSPDGRTQMVEYSDWALGYFLESCSKYSWFDSTIFVITADHGNLIPGFEHHLAYHHIPFIIYAPKKLAAREIEKLGGQIDIYPTVLHLLNIPYTNNSFGINLFKETRDFLPFTYDEELCTIDKKNLLIISQSTENLFEITGEGKNILAADKLPLADAMKVYSQSVMQTLQWMIQKRKMY